MSTIDLISIPEMSLWDNCSQLSHVIGLSDDTRLRFGARVFGIGCCSTCRSPTKVVIWNFATRRI